MSKDDTVVLYILILFFSVFFAFLAQRKSIRGLKGVNVFFFLLSFLIPWFFFVFNDISNDYEEYCYIYNTVSLDNFRGLWIEPGYALINAVLKLSVKDSVVGIVIIKTFIIALIFYVIYDYRFKIDVSLSVLAYLTLLYLDSFCMIRIHLAAALLLLAIALYVNHGMVLLPLMIFCFSCTVHYSLVTLIPVLASYVFWKKTNFKMGFLLMLVFAIVLIMYVAMPLMTTVLKSVSFLNKYNEKYGMISSSGGGFMQYLYHLPIIVLMVKVWKLGVWKKNKAYRICVILIPFSLFFGLLGYSVQVIGRTYVYYAFIWLFGLPMVAKQIKDINNARLFLFICILILLFRFYDYINNSLHPSGIEHFHLLLQ